MELRGARCANPDGGARDVTLRVVWWGLVAEHSPSPTHRKSHRSDAFSKQRFVADGDHSSVSNPEASTVSSSDIRKREGFERHRVWREAADP